MYFHAEVEDPETNQPIIVRYLGTTIPPLPFRALLLKGGRALETTIHTADWCEGDDAPRSGSFLVVRSELRELR